MDVKARIRWLLFDSGETMYAIHKATGIAQTTLSRFTREESDVGNMSLKNALKLIEYYNKLEATKMKQLENARKMVARASEHLRNGRDEVYITLYDSRAQLLEDYDEELHEDMIYHLDNKQAPVKEPFVLIDRSAQMFEESTVVLLNEFDDHMELLEHVEPEYKIKGNLYENEVKEMIKPQMTLENLTASYGNGNGTDDLEFNIEGQTVFLRNAEVEEDNEDEDYWEKGDNLKKAVEESHDDYIEIK